MPDLPAATDARPGLRRVAVYALLVLGAVVFAYPFVWMALATFKPEGELARLTPVPSRWTLDGYRLVFENLHIGRGFANSVLVTGVVTASALVFGSMAAYALARLRWRGRDAAFQALLFSLTVPGIVLLIPLYSLVVRFGWSDSYAGLIVPGMMSATAVLVMRQSFLGLPQDLLDAARIDGASEAHILFRIVWPLSVPALVTAGLLVFIGSWNEVLWPLIVVRNDAKMTMPQMVTLFAVGGGAQAKLVPQLAAALLLALPIVGAYLAFQRHFIASLASTGVKG